MEQIESAYRLMLDCALVLLAIAACLCLLRTILGQRLPDRVAQVNIICIKSIIMIAILLFLLEQNFLIDIAIAYAVIAFFAVSVVSKRCLLPESFDTSDVRTPKKKRHPAEEKDAA